MLKAFLGRYPQSSISHFVPYGTLKTEENNLVYKHFVSNETYSYHNKQFFNTIESSIIGNNGKNTRCAN